MFLLLIGTGLLELVLILFLLSGFGLLIFKLTKRILRKTLKETSDQRIKLISLVSALILPPAIFIGSLAVFIYLSMQASQEKYDDQIIDNAVDFDIQTMDNESNTINLIATARYKIIRRLQNKLKAEYGREYKDSLLVPPFVILSNETLKEYSAAEIYSYKREEIEQKLAERVKTKFDQLRLELTKFSIWSVKLPDTLMRRFEKEHLERLNPKTTDDRN